MDLLSLSTPSAVPLPGSSPSVTPRKSSPSGSSVVSNTRNHYPNLIRKTPSLTSIGASKNSVTPTLHKKASISSLQGVNGVTPPRSPLTRRVSSSLLSPPTGDGSSKSTLQTPFEAPPSIPAPSPASFAKEYFRRDLERHDSSDGQTASPDAIVIIQDACYGHRFSRPRTSKANLNTIVERPERMNATLLGLAAAYVRLGGHHIGGFNPPQIQRLPGLLHSLPFTIRKTSRAVLLKSQAVTDVHGIKWMEELSSMCASAEARLVLDGKELIRPENSTQGDDDDRPVLHEGDLYLCSESLNALEGSLGGVCEAVDEVFSPLTSPKRAFVCVRPPGHHCSATYPSGFCWLNNVHVGISHASIAHGLTHAAIIDFDLHHGDGSQSITWAHNAKVAGLPRNTAASKKTAIGYFSLHDINSYPCEWGEEEKVRNASLCLENAHGQTIWNVHLQPWKTDSDFWQLYRDRYSTLITKARVFLRLHAEKFRSLSNHSQPKAAIFISAGFDASEWEGQGMQRHKVNVPTEFYARFTEDIVRLANEEGLGTEGRVISVLEGGYSDRALTSGVLSHICGLTADVEPSDRRATHAGLNPAMEGDFNTPKGSSTLDGEQKVSHTQSAVPFLSHWWALQQLEELENVVNPPPQLTVPKKSRRPVGPTYSTPTQSYTAKIVTPPPNRRSFSASTLVASIHQSSDSNPWTSTLPPPEVDWATAAHELCKLLIPSDRPTRSYRLEELNVEATRVRRDRQSTVGLQPEKQTTNGQRMQLRERKAKAQNHEPQDEERVVVSKPGRRKTLAVAAALDEDRVTQQDFHLHPNYDNETGFVGVRPARRLSTASSMLSTGDDRSITSSASGFRQPSSNEIRPSTRRSSSSSLSVRPGSIMNDPQQLPKARKIASPNKSRVVTSGSKARGSTKLPPVPRVPSSSYVKAPDVKPTASSTQDSDANSAAPLPTGKDLLNENMNQLSRGMHKMSIKLNMPPKADAEIKERAKKAPSRSSRKSVGGKPTEIVKIPIDDALTSQVLPTPELPSKGEIYSTAAMTEALHPGAVSQETDMSNRNLPHQGHRSDMVDKETLSQPSAAYNPSTLDAVPAFTSKPQSLILDSSKSTSGIKVKQLQNSAEQMEPTSTASWSSTGSKPQTPKKTKQDLPKFTSTSPIVFAPPNKEAGSTNQIIAAKTQINDDKTLSADKAHPGGTAPAPPSIRDPEGRDNVERTLNV